MDIKETKLFLANRQSNVSHLIALTLSYTNLFSPTHAIIYLRAYILRLFFRGVQDFIALTMFRTIANLVCNLDKTTVEVPN